MPELHEQRENVRRLLTSITEAGRQKSDRYEKAAVIENEIAAMLEQRLRVAGELDDVFPLDDADLRRQSNLESGCEPRRRWSIS